jgi:hypothetical protein
LEFNWEEPTGSSIYSSTGKDIEMRAEVGDRLELAYWMFANRLESNLPQGGTLSEVYHQVSVPLGLSVDDTRELLKRAIKAGFVKRSRG